MKIQLIRSATLKITMAGRTFIIDPYLAPKHGMPSYTGRSRNPLVDLPFPPREILASCEMAIISHIHSDHFDPTAQTLLSKSMPLFCQPGDENQLTRMGFNKVTPVVESVEWRGIHLTRTPAQHGSGSVLSEMGQASGFYFEAEGEPSLYWVGDTIRTPAMDSVMQTTRPNIIVTHSGGAVWGDNVPIIMDAEQTIQVCRLAPNSTVIAVHMEALDHCTVTRSALRHAANAAAISPAQLLIPDDGESITLCC